MVRIFSLFLIVILNTGAAGGQTLADTAPGLSVEHNGLTYYFANRADRGQFTAEPERFAPEYGGFCVLDGRSANTASSRRNPSARRVSSPSRSVDAIWNRVRNGQTNPATVC
ncbi:MAG: hypothetical protein U1F68_19835 [Gammaproteobacteria bacterium]